MCIIQLVNLTKIFVRHMDDYDYRIIQIIPISLATHIDNDIMVKVI